MSKSVRKEKATQARKDAKAEKMRRYASYAADGKAKGSRRAKRKAKASGASKHAHLVAHCGNLGCERCYPQFSRDEFKSQQVAAAESRAKRMAEKQAKKAKTLVPSSGEGKSTTSEQAAAEFAKI